MYIYMYLFRVTFRDNPLTHSFQLQDTQHTSECKI